MHSLKKPWSKPVLSAITDPSELDKYIKRAETDEQRKALIDIQKRMRPASSDQAWGRRA